MTRIRSAFLSGTITDNPLLIGATTINSAALANMPAVSSPDIAVMILDPTGSAGAPEVVWVTAHTGGATSATIQRAKEGTTARQHALGIAWAHGPTLMDFNNKKGADIASASTLTLPSTDEDYFVITGTTTVTAISERGAGSKVTLRFSGACPITHNATSLILLGGASYTTTANDVLTFISENSGNWRQISGPPAQTATQQHVVRSGVNTAEQSTTSTSAVDLVTVSGLSIPVTSAVLIQINARKSAAAFAVDLGLKVNSTITREAGTAGSSTFFDNTNFAETSYSNIWLFPRSANYLVGGYWQYLYTRSSAALATSSVRPDATAAIPNATITSITIRGAVENAGITLFVKEVAIFEYKEA